MKKVYLAGQPNQYANNWKELFKVIPDFQWYDWEFQSDQTSPDTFFPDDIRAVAAADILIAYPGTAPSEATWMEVGAFYLQNVQQSGDFCKNLIVIWPDDRNPRWSIEFVKKAGKVVATVEEAIEEVMKLI